jgi:hypothetical protein
MIASEAVDLSATETGSTCVFSDDGDIEGPTRPLGVTGDEVDRVAARGETDVAVREVGVTPTAKSVALPADRAQPVAVPARRWRAGTHGDSAE